VESRLDCERWFTLRLDHTPMDLQHIRSADPEEDPVIDPHYFEEEYGE
jgi:hypothetical protein